MSRDPTLITGLQQPAIWLFVAVRIEFPAKTVRLILGSQIVTLDTGSGPETFEGSDDDFGSLAAIEPISDGGEGEAPELRIVLHPPEGASNADMANAAMQGATVAIMAGVYNPETGAAIGTPEQLFLGEIDVPRLILGARERAVEYSIISVFDRFFEVDEGERATDANHQAIWPGETGLSGIDGTTQRLWWLGKPPAGAAASPGRTPDGSRGYYYESFHE